LSGERMTVGQPVDQHVGDVMAARRRRVPDLGVGQRGAGSRRLVSWDGLGFRHPRLGVPLDDVGRKH